MSDADWFSLGRAVPVRRQYRQFQRIFDLDLTGYRLAPAPERSHRAGAKRRRECRYTEVPG